MGMHTDNATVKRLDLWQNLQPDATWLYSGYLTNFCEKKNNIIVWQCTN